MTTNAASTIDAILDALDTRDLDAARDRFDRAARRWTPGVVVKALAATVDIPGRAVVWGFGIDVWANPWRSGYAWRCGACRWTGSNYAAPRAAQRAAEAHADDHRISGGPVVKVVEYADAASAGNA